MNFSASKKLKIKLLEKKALSLDIIKRLVVKILSDKNDKILILSQS